MTKPEPDIFEDYERYRHRIILGIAMLASGLSGLMTFAAADNPTGILGSVATLAGSIVVFLSAMGIAYKWRPN